MSERAYITILRWPKSFAQEDRVRALAESLGLDPYTARLRAIQEAPLIVARVDVVVAKDVLQKLRAMSVSAFGVSKSQLSKLANGRQIKRLSPADGAAEPMYMVEFWKGEPIGLKASDIFLLVRGTIDRSISRTTIEPDPSMRSYGDGNGMQEPIVTRSTEIKLAQVLDIYLNDGALLRVNSDRMSFDVLGKSRGLTAADNTDKLAVRLGAEAPSALVDTGFSRFKPPADLAPEPLQLVNGNTTTTQRDEGSLFDFYSAWTYAMNRCVSGGTRA
jgi:hypothetical protein